MIQFQRAKPVFKKQGIKALAWWAKKLAGTGCTIGLVIFLLVNNAQAASVNKNLAPQVTHFIKASSSVEWFNLIQSTATTSAEKKFFKKTREHVARITVLSLALAIANNETQDFLWLVWKLGLNHDREKLDPHLPEKYGITFQQSVLEFLASKEGTNIHEKVDRQFIDRFNKVGEWHTQTLLARHGYNNTEAGRRAVAYIETADLVDTFLYREGEFGKKPMEPAVQRLQRINHERGRDADQVDLQRPNWAQWLENSHRKGDWLSVTQKLIPSASRPQCHQTLTQ